MSGEDRRPTDFIAADGSTDLHRQTECMRLKVDTTATTRNCPSCLKDKPLNEFNRNLRSKTGTQHYCRECQTAKRTTPAKKFEEYQKRAATNNMAFGLTLQDFIECAASSCTYCGDQLEYAAFDRIDSNGGYTHDNVVPCCDECNFMKRAYSEDKFFEKAFKIACVFDPPDDVQRTLVQRYPRGHEHVFAISDKYVFEVRLRKLD